MMSTTATSPAGKENRPKDGKGDSGDRGLAALRSELPERTLFGLIADPVHAPILIGPPCLLGHNDGDASRRAWERRRPPAPQLVRRARGALVRGLRLRPAEHSHRRHRAGLSRARRPIRHLHPVDQPARMLGFRSSTATRLQIASARPSTPTTASCRPSWRSPARTTLTTPTRTAYCGASRC